jgi:putative flavoprotein involved in K+ transport
MLEIDKEILDGLSQRGFKWDIGEDGTGHQMKFRRRFGGYYLNCGCSELIVNGEIGLLQYEDIERFVPNGVRMKNGSIEEADMLVAATGYQSQREVIKEILGEEIAAKVGDIWGIAADGELNNMFRVTAQPGLWFAGGGFAQARIYSQYVALWIKAQQEGLLV